MSFTGLAPPPFFLPTLGRPSLSREQWEQMFNVYLLASGAAAFKPQQRKAILLHCLGAEGQRIYQTLHAGTSAAAPAAPSATALADDKSVVAPPDEYDFALAVLRHQFSTSRNVIIERHRFHRRSQHTGESVHDFVAALREIASHCSFASQDDALRDQFVAGVASTRVRERLLLEGSALSFENSVRIALQFEQAAEELKELSASVEAISLRMRRKPSSHSSKKRNSQPAATLEQNLTSSAGGSPPTSEAEIAKQEGIVLFIEPACVTKEELRQAALDDSCLETFKSFVLNSWPPKKSIPEEAKPFYAIRENLSVVDNLLLRGERLVGPCSLTAQIIGTAHETHRSITRTKARLRERFWWPRMDKHVETALKSDISAWRQIGPPKHHQHNCNLLNGLSDHGKSLA
ncbi:uncharacterized protein [Dermacentor albipictus]|uniref:uncharacterized protein n=1 Tax=Dermacentor albipictus TaxID=60249 RepID=UPI0031FCC811